MIFWPEDTAEQIKAMRGAGQPWHTVARYFGVSEQTAAKKAKELGVFEHRKISLRGTKPSRFSPEELEYLRVEWAKNTPVLEIARHLGRSRGVILQRVWHFEPGLTKRDLIAVRLVRRLGHEILKEAGTPAEIRERINVGVAAAKAEAKQKAQAAKETHVRRMLEIADLEISTGKNRNDVIFKTRHAGVSLESLGRHFGVSRERIRQICEHTALQRGLALAGMKESEAAQ